MKAVYFYADYCGLCHALRKSVIDKLVKRGADIEAVDVMDRPYYADKFGITRIPTVIVIDGDGEEYARYTDMFTVGVLEDDLGV